MRWPSRRARRANSRPVSPKNAAPELDIPSGLAQIGGARGSPRAKRRRDQVMQFFVVTARFCHRLSCAAALVGLSLGLAAPAHAAPSLVADLVTGQVIAQDEATRPWFPASLTKLMTAYVALKAVRAGRVSMDTPFVMSLRASRAPPSKMGFNPGVEVTLDNALKMLMVKSANDLAVMIAEGISGSVEDFADEMNQSARALGMRQSHFVNPNGLHDPAHVSSARDLALLARALYMEFPEQAELYGSGALRLGERIIPTHNGLIGRYPGADGMKTGFVCASGFNVVASARRGGRQIVVVVMGSHNAKVRTIKAANLFDAGFAASGSFRPAMLDSLADLQGPAPNMREEICGRHKKVVQEDDLAVVGAPAPAADESPAAFFANDGRPPNRQLVLGPRPVFEPIDVFVGRKPNWTGPVAQARAAPRDIPGAIAAAPTAASAIAFAPQPGIGATASRAIAVKSLPAPKSAVKKHTAAARKKPLVKNTSAKPTPVKAASKAKEKAQ